MAKPQQQQRRSPAPPAARTAQKAEGKRNPAPRSVEIDEDDSEDEDEGEGSKREKRSDKAMLTIRIMRLMKGAARVQHSLGKDTGEDELDALTAALKALGEMASALPETWQRAKVAGGAVTRTIEPGTMVRVREKRVAAYADLVDKKDLVDLKVVKQAGNKLAVKTSSGQTLFFPLAHITTETADSDEE